jgi:hypothetical protein
VALIDRDRGQHLSRVFGLYPPGVPGMVLGEDPAADLRIVDTAPEANADRAIGYPREADWVLVPVKGPEAGSVLALPMLLEWIQQAHAARLLGFCPRCTGSLAGLTNGDIVTPVLDRRAVRPRHEPAQILAHASAPLAARGRQAASRLCAPRNPRSTDAEPRVGGP